MKYLLCTILLVFALGTAGEQLYYTHVLTLIPAVVSMGCFGFALFLFDSTQFLAFSADVRKSATCYFKRGSDV